MLQVLLGELNFVKICFYFELCVCMYVCLYKQGPVLMIRVSAAGVTRSCEPPDLNWEVNSGPLKES